MNRPSPPARPLPCSRQLALPLEPPARGHPPPSLAMVSVTTRQVWAGLAPAMQGHLRQIVLRVVQEVVHESHDR